ncbi:UNVERIFIED_CONTAM: hypothetical protein HDU68_010270 [Siphonaria sp. JEL0065]|nr:hypothetical protein HDU68_010270 [Siphonaria sp. JEL0065]
MKQPATMTASTGDLHALAGESSLLPTFRGDGIIKDVTVQEVASVLRGFGARKLWDPRFEHGKLLETLSDTANLVLSSQRGNLIVRSRDFVTANIYQLENTADEAVVVSTSVKDSLAPAEGFWGNYVRAEAKAIGWLLKQEGKNVAVTYIVEVDVKGQIPQSLIKLIQVQAPLCIQNVSEAIQKHGTLPFVILGPSQFSPSERLQIKSEWVEPGTNVYTVRVSIPPGKSNFSISMPVKGKYSAGTCMETTNLGGIKVIAEQTRRRSVLDQVVGSATEVTLRVKPYVDVHRRFGVPAIVGSAVTKDSVFELNGERIDEDAASPVDSAVGLDEKFELAVQRYTVAPGQPPMADMIMGIIDTTWDMLMEYSTDTIVSGYVYWSTFLYGVPTVQQPSRNIIEKSHYEKLDDDRIFQMVLEHVLQPTIAV